MQPYREVLHVIPEDSTRGRSKGFTINMATLDDFTTLPYMPTAPSVNGRGKAWLTDGGGVFAEASVSQSNRFAGFFPLLPACCYAR